MSARASSSPGRTSNTSRRSGLIITDYGIPIVLHSALALGAVAAATYAVARAAGLADLGRRVDLLERSVRRGEGDPELARALKSDAEGDWD